jgi:hypothetical protein
MSERIEFYKNRSIGDRFSVAVDFLKQNWKVLFKNILIGGLPLSFILGFLLASQLGAISDSGIAGLVFHTILFYLFTLLSVIYMYAMTGSVLLHYERNLLTQTTGWSDLKNTFFQLSGKTILITIIIYTPLLLILGGVIALTALLASAGAGSTGTIFLLILFILLIIGGMIALSPSFIMLYFPAYFSGKGILQSIKISFFLGFKNWGSLFVAILLAGIILAVISIVFGMPFQIISIFSIGKISIISYIFATLSAIGSIITYPIMVVIFAFQYFSIVEKEEGISLQAQIEDFENL